VPELRARVTDLAHLLPPDRAQRLEETLARYEEETGHQIAVLTVPTTAGEPIESFALRVAEAWKLGQKGADNGALLVVASQDRRARIEVGYGLEGAIPDAIAKRVIDEVMAPRFRAGDFAGGLEDAAQALMTAARGEAIRVERPPARRGVHQDPSAALLFAVMFGAVVSMPLGGRQPLRSLLAGALAGGFSYLLLASLGWAVLSFALAALFSGTGGMSGRGGRGGGPIFLPGGGGFGGRYGGGGGFSGGGGGFGGGGASGSW
jgi:uncharacterized protein